MGSKTAILDYDAGNLASVERAVHHLGGSAVITNDKKKVRDAAKILFPGVGAAGAAMESLRRLELDEEILRAHRSGKPILGICVGCQVIFEESEEDGGISCLGLLPGEVVRFQFPSGIHRKIPHMGWNRVDFRGGTNDQSLHPVFQGIEAGSEFYFVHGYHPVPKDPKDAQGMAVYGGVRFAAAVARDNLAAVQFHTEKSGRFGLRVLENFLNWSQ